MILVIGEILIDMVGNIASNSLQLEGKLGGAPFNVASNLADLDVNTTFYGVVGKDVIGDFLLDQLQEHKECLNLFVKQKEDRMTTTDFDKIIWRDALTFVDFFATWCGPCQMMHPAIDKFQREMNGRVDVYKVDIDDRGMLDAVHRYNIMSVPTLMFFRRGEVLWRESGRVGYDHLVNVLRELEKREQVAQR